MVKLGREEFVVAWQSSATLAEAAKKAGTSTRAASTRAFNMRKAGVPLQKFGDGGERIDVDALTKLAKKTKK